MHERVATLLSDPYVGRELHKLIEEVIRSEYKSREPIPYKSKFTGTSGLWTYTDCKVITDRHQTVATVFNGDDGYLMARSKDMFYLLLQIYKSDPDDIDFTELKDRINTILTGVLGQ